MSFYTECQIHVLLCDTGNISEWLVRECVLIQVKGVTYSYRNREQIICLSKEHWSVCAQEC